MPFFNKNNTILKTKYKFWHKLVKAKKNLKQFQTSSNKFNQKNINKKLLF